MARRNTRVEKQVRRKKRVARKAPPPAPSVFEQQPPRPAFLDLPRPMCRFERLARARHERDLELTRRHGGHPKGFWFDEAAGLRVVEFIETYCRHWKGEWAGQLVKLSEWQRWIIVVLFGWKRRDGTRRFRKAWIEINRKNGKTFLAAAIALYLLIADQEPGAEVYATATAEEQAQRVLDDAIAMAAASPELSEFVEHLKSKGGTLYCAALRSKMKALSSEARNKDGLSPHGDIRDEIHEWNDPDLAAKLDTASGARRQPMTVEITTAGVYDQEALGWQHHQYAVDILEGLFEDDRVFAFIAGVEEDDDPIHARDDPELGVPACWLRANPNLGTSCKLDFVREQVEEARNNPRKVNDVLRLHFGRWTAQVTRWLDVERWRKADPLTAEQAVKVREDRAAALAGRLCFGGLDLASKSDLAAFVLMFPLDDGVLEFLARFYLPEDAIERELKKKGRRHYREFVDAGWIKATPGAITDYDFIEADILEARDRFELRALGYDPANATQVANNLTAEGLNMIEVRQGPLSLSEGCKLFEAKILGLKVRHGGNPVLTWNVGNAVARRDANDNIAPDKKKAKDKIDGVSAAANAMHVYVLEKPKPPPAYGRGRGILWLE